jgi:hypothetical protein
MIKVNCKSDFCFQVGLKTPAATTGTAGAPVLGAVTGITLRLSATRTGAAINAAVGALGAAERTATPGRFYYVVDAALLTTHVLPIGVGKTFYAIWSKAGDMDMEAVSFAIADGTVN